MKNHECNALCVDGQHAAITYTTKPDATSAREAAEREAAGSGYVVIDFSIARELPPAREYVEDHPELAKLWQPFLDEEGLDYEDFPHPWLVILKKVDEVPA